MGVSKLPVMEYVPLCPLSLKGILYQSLQSPHLLPLPPPSLGPRGQACPWVNPSQGTCLAPTISRPPSSTAPSQHCRVILSKLCFCFPPPPAPASSLLPLYLVQAALPGFLPLNLRSHPADLGACSLNTVCAPVHCRPGPTLGSTSCPHLCSESHLGYLLQEVLRTIRPSFPRLH